MKEQLRDHSIIGVEKTLNILRERVNLSGKPVLIVSDLDGTLANTHTFDAEINIHRPNISQKLVSATKALTVPILIATGRADNDPTIKEVWQQLSRPPMPVIGENGGVIIDLQGGTVTATVSTSEMTKFLKTATDLPSLITLLHKNLIVPGSHEILIDSSRKTSLEVRIQDKLTKVGSPKIHQDSSIFLKEKLSDSNLSIVSSDSSVSIHPSSISKGNSVLKVLLDHLGLNRSEIFIITLGDADNDKSLFDMADLGIGVGISTIGKSEITCLGGETTSIEIIKAIGALRI